MKLKTLFWWGMAIWWIGGLIGYVSGVGIIHTVSVNIFGTLTVGLGLFLLVRWVWRKFTKKDQVSADQSESGS